MRKSNFKDKSDEFVEGVEYQTIGSYSRDYKKFDVINTYKTLKEAREHYKEDMNSYSKEYGKGKSFGIRMVDNRSKR